MKIKLNKFKLFLKRLPRKLAENAFLTFLGLFFIILIFSSLVFYKYIVSAQKAEPKITEQPLQFKKDTYENILKIWQEREERFKATETKKYPNPFYVATSTDRVEEK